MSTDLTADDAEFECEVQSGKIIAPTSALEGWDDNPREAEDEDIGRLADMLEGLGQFKPLLVEPDGTVIGGNMRIEALDELGWSEAWISLIDPADKDERIEYALADNDRVGHYTEESVADLIGGRDIDITKFKPDFYEPTDFAQNMARAMDGDEILELTSDDSSSSEESEDNDSDADGSGGDAPDRSLENIGGSSTTEMIQLFMTGDAKERVMNYVEDLKEAYGEDTTSDVVERAVAEEHARRVENSEARTSAEMIADGDD